jgi:hypothetical protein
MEQAVHSLFAPHAWVLGVDDVAVLEVKGCATFDSVHSQNAGLSTEAHELDDVGETEILQIAPEFHE